MVLTNDDKKKNDEVVIALQCEYKSGKLDGTKIEYQRTLENRIFIKSQYVNGKMNGDEFYDSFGDKAWEVLFGEGTNALRSITSREVNAASSAGNYQAIVTQPTLSGYEWDTVNVEEAQRRKEAFWGDFHTVGMVTPNTCTTKDLKGRTFFAAYTSQFHTMLHSVYANEIVGTISVTPLIVGLELHSSNSKLLAIGKYGSAYSLNVDRTEFREIVSINHTQTIAGVSAYRAKKDALYFFAESTESYRRLLVRVNIASNFLLLSRENFLTPSAAWNK